MCLSYSDPVHQVAQRRSSGHRVHGEETWLEREASKVTFKKHSAPRSKKIYINQRFPSSHYWLACMVSELQSLPSLLVL